MPALYGVPDSCQHIRNRICYYCHPYRSPDRCYQLDFLTPGILPSSANFRKQIRHMPKRRMYARGRPQILHRFRTRTLYLRFFSRAIIDFLATFLLPDLPFCATQY